MKRVFFIALTMLLASAYSSSAIYKYTDENGHVTFTNTEIDGSVKITSDSTQPLSKDLPDTQKKQLKDTSNKEIADELVAKDNKVNKIKEVTIDSEIASYPDQSLSNDSVSSPEKQYEISSEIDTISTLAPIESIGSNTDFIAAVSILLIAIIAIFFMVAKKLKPEDSPRRKDNSIISDQENEVITPKNLGFILHRISFHGMQADIFEQLPVKIDTVSGENSLVIRFNTNPGFVRKHLIALKTASGIAYASLVLKLSKEQLISLSEGINESVKDMTYDDGTRFSQESVFEMVALIEQYSKSIIDDYRTNRSENSYCIGKYSSLFIKYMSWGFGGDNPASEYSKIEQIQLRSYIDIIPDAIIESLSKTVTTNNGNIVISTR